MDRDQSVFLKLISNAIGNNEKIEFNGVNFKQIVAYAIQQNLETMILSSLKNEGIVLDEEVKNTINKASILNNIRQINFIKKMEHVLKDIADKEIDVIVLKGLVLRDYYSNPLFRTMGDGDIFVKEKDIKVTIDILKENGFNVISEGGVHIKLEDSNNFFVEVHWKLIDSHYFKKEVKFNSEIWNFIEPFTFGGGKCYKFNDTSFLIYLFLHLAKHKKYKSISIRSLCDIVIFIKGNHKNINWNEFNSYIIDQGIEIFVYNILYILNTNFNLECSYDLLVSHNNDAIDELWEEIFEGGVHGKKSLKESYIRSNPSGYFIGADKLPERYSYAKKYKILLPIAWVHRIFMGIINSELSLKDKINYVLCGKSKKRVIDSLNEKLGL